MMLSCKLTYCTTLLIVCLMVAVCLACSAVVAEQIPGQQVTDQTQPLGTEWPVASAEDIAQAMKSAKPGDTLVMTDGEWVDQRLVFTGKGTEDSPLTLRAETPGGVVLKGRSGLVISGQWLVVDGLLFENAAAQPKEQIIAFTGPDGDAVDCRLMNTVMINCNPDDPKTKYNWVEVHGLRNRIDHCRFEGRNHRGVTVVVGVGSEPAGHRIDRNYFVGRAPAAMNYREFESIRIGQNGSADLQSGVTVAYNMFENEAGDADVVLTKAGGSTIHHNSFIGCTGGVCLRQGDGSVVEGNVFMGQDAAGANGIVVAGPGHKIVGNYLQDIDGLGQGVIALAAGAVDPTSKTYERAKDTLIAFNTIINPRGSAVLMDWGVGSDGIDQIPANIRIANNVFLGQAGENLFAGNEGEGWVFTNNICYNAPLGITQHPGLIVADPAMTESSTGVWRPGPGSPLINAGVPVEGVADGNDIDGHPRDQDLLDIGADVINTIRSNPRGAPMSSDRVGPKLQK